MPRAHFLLYALVSLANTLLPARGLWLGTITASSSADYLLSHNVPISERFDNVETALRALSAGDIHLLVYDRAVLEYFIAQLQLEKKTTLLPVRFNQQYRSFYLPKRSPHLEWINPLLVRKLNEASWQDLLRKYALDE